MSRVIREPIKPCIAQRTVDTPLGIVLLARGQDGLCGLWFEDQKHHPGTLQVPVMSTDPLLTRAASQLQDYLAGRPRDFSIPLDLHGTPFQKKVWSALMDIPRGQTSTYSDIARTIGAPLAVRAVGAAIGKNPLSVFVPCHRVVGLRGQLTGYAGGLERKQALLNLETS